MGTYSITNIGDSGAVQFPQPEPVRYEPNSRYLYVAHGQFTFDIEGNEGPTAFSRRITWPTGNISGVTVGRGYDMGSRSRQQIDSELRRAGLCESAIAFFVSAAELKGHSAKKFVELHRDTAPTLRLEEQQALYSKVLYPYYLSEAKRLATKADVVKKYGQTNWMTLNPGIKEMLYDMTYRGDYTPTLRERIQKYVVKNDLEGFYNVMRDSAYWQPGKSGHVAKHRFEARVAYLETAMKQM